MERRSRSSSGFSLLEVIVATALMGMAVVGLLSLTSQSLSNAARVGEYDRAAMLARSQMNQLLAIDPLPLDSKLEGRFEDVAGPVSGWEARVTPLERPWRPADGPESADADRSADLVGGRRTPQDGYARDLSPDRPPPEARWLVHNSRAGVDSRRGMTLIEVLVATVSCWRCSRRVC